MRRSHHGSARAGGRSELVVDPGDEDHPTLDGRCAKRESLGILRRRIPRFERVHARKLGDDHGLLWRFVGGPVGLDDVGLSAADEVAAAELGDGRRGTRPIVLPGLGIEDLDL
jgi:hypothetical protein